MKNFLSKPLQFHRPEEGHRQASWLELFIDLSFVLAISSLTVGFGKDANYSAVIEYAAAFFLVFWVWNRVSWYATYFFNDDVIFRLSYFLIVFGVIAFSATIGQIREGEYLYPTLIYIFVELLIISLWARIYFQAKYKTYAKFFFYGYLIGLGFIILSLFVSNNFKPFLWLTAILVEAVSPVLAWKKHDNGVPVHSSHIIERHGLFVIILLGEGVIALSKSIHFPLHFIDLLPIFVAFGIVCAIWWVYFDCNLGINTKLSEDAYRTFIFGYGEFAVFLSIAFICFSMEVGLHGLISKTTNLHETKIASSLLVAATGIFLISLGLIQMFIAEKKFQKMQISRLFVGAIAVITAFFTFDKGFNFALFISFFLLTSIVIYDTLIWGKVKDANTKAVAEQML